jgi:hypothetical protein
MIILEGDWILFQKRWFQVWSVLSPSTVMFRDGTQLSNLEKNVEKVLSNTAFFEQKRNHLLGGIL